MIDTRAAGNQVVVEHSETLPTRMIPGGLMAAEGVRAKDFAVFVSWMAPGDGEDWHTHKAGVETAYYVVGGTGRVSWRVDGVEQSVVARQGDLLSIPPGVQNKIENIGTSPWVIVAVHTNLPGDDTLRLRE